MHEKAIHGNVWVVHLIRSGVNIKAVLLIMSKFPGGNVVTNIYKYKHALIISLSGLLGFQHSHVMMRMQCLLGILMAVCWEVVPVFH